MNINSMDLMESEYQEYQSSYTKCSGKEGADLLWLISVGN